ncbi:hypothetical protein LEP1GSC116_2376 [Leptospira interrogans serovar Icterohaemorrhagiae str. Verdun HP]|uniref:Uncharacterized protein n=2 Tax=Leptospira interrogans TaxID=173 RepID=M6ZXQ5_LEPIR|nr:hypothetical protein LEP1GSC116_2376 [Leptospira interrogans serovar Icterohaemorrhagiae str. Verdun HP]EMP09077.1 hypothetical protein LEP1GSC124_1541 [Leptospira interrogans serovar Pyrogenes str. 200701872]
MIRNKQKDSKRKKEKYSRKNQSFSTVSLEEDKNFEVEWKEVKNEEERRSTEPD